MIYECFVKRYFKVYTHKKIELNSNSVYRYSDINYVLNEIHSEFYYLIENNRVIWRKKKYRFVGEMVKMSNSEVLDFVAKVTNDWCRSFYLAPVEKTGKAIFINEEGSFFLIEPDNVFS